MGKRLASVLVTALLVVAVPGCNPSTTNKDGTPTIEPVGGQVPIRPVISPGSTTVAHLGVPFPVAVPALPDPPEEVLRAQAAMKVPEGYFRAENGRIFAEKDGTEMVLVPGGRFTMGVEEAGEHDAAHEVEVSSFLMDRHEINETQYALFLIDTKKEAPAAIADGAALLPVARVSWNDAAAYAAWAGRRLPTEAEWERAARGTDGRLFPWGDEDDPKKFNGPGEEDGYMGRSPVGSFPQGASPFGVLDLLGNVSEWCADGYERYRVREEGQPVPRDPVTPLGRKGRALRGGEYIGPSGPPGDDGLTAVWRIGMEPDAASFASGIRCAVSIP